MNFTAIKIVKMKTSGVSRNLGGSNSLPELNISRSDRNISMMEFLVPRNTNLQSKHQKAPLASIDNVIDVPATESESVIGGVIIHVRHAIDTTPPSQIPPQDSLSPG